MLPRSGGSGKTTTFQVSTKSWLLVAVALELGSDGLNGNGAVGIWLFETYPVSDQVKHRRLAGGPQ
jgi:hypothetical protein